MHNSIILIALVAGPLTSLAQTLACQPSDGMYVQTGHNAFSAASAYDATILKSKFYVERSTGTVIGGALYRTEDKKREVVRSDDKALELLLRTSLGDTFVIKLARSSERWTFTHYSSWLSLLLVGTCEPV
jgi:hypothetical protein